MTAVSARVPPAHVRASTRSSQWREWSGYYAAASTPTPRHRVQRDPRGGRAHRRLAAVQVRRVAGRTRVRLVDRVITRDATKLAGRPGHLHAVVRRAGQGHRRRDGRPARRDTSSAGRRPTRSCAGSSMNAAGLDVQIEDVTEAVAALALQGPLSRAVLEAATGEDLGGPAPTSARRAPRSPAVAVDVTRTGYTGDLGYELWVDGGAARRRLGRADGGRASRTASGRPACSRWTSPASRPG